MSSLHIIRRSDDNFAVQAVRFEKTGGKVAVLFVQDAVSSDIADVAPIYVSEPDLRARGMKSPHEAMDYEGMARLISEYDRVVVW